MKKNGKLQGLLRTIGEYALSVGVFIASGGSTLR